jgi:UDP-N-acetylmuramoyl-L-alanyl-D-glutamate--2,6-diaminopimelate ligase
MLPPVYAGPDVCLTELSEDTRTLQPGACFVARVRTGSDGHQWIGQAVAAGAVLVVGQRPLAELDAPIPSHVPYVQVADTAEALAWLAAAWHGFPSRQLVVVGVTGTNGKTTTVNLLHAILQAAGCRVGMLSTLKAVIGDEEEALALHVSTPEAPVVQHFLRRMVDAGMTHCVLETTSHGLAQHRVTAVDYDLAVITNITHEHLDYHGSFADYFAAKARLFEMVAAQSQPGIEKPVAVAKTAVLNRDDSSYDGLARIQPQRQMSYSLHDQSADIYAENVVTAPDGSWFDLVVGGERVAVRSSLLGLFSVLDMLAAAAAAAGLGISLAHIQAGLAVVQRVHGRMHQIERGQPFIVHVDFAHTPDGLEKAIAAARGILQQVRGGGQIIVLFGSAGKRDPEKRRMMAEIAAQQAELTILTAEDPRTESLDEILQAMADGCVAQGGVEGQSFWRIRDRGRAIYFALTLAQPEDFVLVCGKGHEQSMCFGTVEYPWDDIVATETALDAFLAGEPMPDLGLPTFEA